MHFKVLVISTIVAALAEVRLEVEACVGKICIPACNCHLYVIQITRIRAGPIEMIYTGYSCDWPNKLNCTANIPPELTCEKPTYQNAKAKEVTNNFDFAIEKSKQLPGIKFDLMGQTDSMGDNKKDWDAVKEVATKSSATHLSRNIRHPIKVDNMAESSAALSHIMVILLEPLIARKPRNRRDITRIFMKTRKYEKRSERLVKKYSIHLNKRRRINEARNPIRGTARYTDNGPKTLLQLLHNLANLLNPPTLRNKRDIKVEYDLMGKEHEIVQYTRLPKTLDPNFKRNQYDYRKICDLATQSSNETAKRPMRTTTVTKQDTLNITDDDKQIDSHTNTMYVKRNTGNYNDDCCALVLKVHAPTSYLPFTYEAVPAYIVTSRNANEIHPISGKYVGYSYDTYPSRITDNDPLPKRTVQEISNAQLDRIIASIVNKHSSFIKASSHGVGVLTYPPYVQEAQAKDFLKRLNSHKHLSWFDAYHHQQHSKASDHSLQ